MGETHCNKCWLAGFKTAMTWAETNNNKISVDINVTSDNDNMSSIVDENMTDSFESNIVASEPFAMDDIQIPAHHISETTDEEWDTFFDKFVEMPGRFISKIEMLKIFKIDNQISGNSWRVMRSQLKNRGYDYIAQKIVQNNGIRIKGWVRNIKYIGGP